MTQDEEWVADTPRPGLLQRFLDAGGGQPAATGRPAGGALLVTALGAAAFVASLALRWQSVTVPRDFNLGSSGAYSLGVSATTPELLGLVYALGVVGLLGLTGAVLTRAEAALRHRMMAAGLTVGLLGVVLAITITLPDSVSTRLGGFTPPAGSGLTTAYEPGLLCAYAAVVLPIVAIWLAARPAQRTVPVVRGPRHAVRPAEQSDGRGPVPRAAGAAEPIDLTVTPDG